MASKSLSHFALQRIVLLLILLGSSAAATAQGRTTASLSDEEQQFVDTYAADSDDSLGFGAGGFWARGEYLLWSTNGTRVPALVSQSPPGTPLNQAGVLGANNTTVLFGNQDVHQDLVSGVRVSAGVWLDGDRYEGIEGYWLTLPNDGPDPLFTATSPGTPILGRPYTNANTGLPAAELVSYPGILAGKVTVSGERSLESAGMFWRHNLESDTAFRLDLLAGYRYLRFGESLRVREQLTSTNTGGLVPLGTTFDLLDNFSANNQFHGADVGLGFATRVERWELDSQVRLGLGNVRQILRTSSSTTVTVPRLPPTTSPGGLLVLPSNTGTFTADRFGLLPEFIVNAKFHLTERFAVSVGYNVLLLDHMLRVGEQVDTVVNPNQIGGVAVPPLRPAAPMADSFFLAQGLNVGFEAGW